MSNFANAVAGKRALNCFRNSSRESFEGLKANLRWRNIMNNSFPKQLLISTLWVSLFKPLQRARSRFHAKFATWHNFQINNWLRIMHQMWPKNPLLKRDNSTRRSHKIWMEVWNELKLSKTFLYDPSGDFVNHSELEKNVLENNCALWLCNFRHCIVKASWGREIDKRFGFCKSIGHSFETKTKVCQFVQRDCNRNPKVPMQAFHC